MTHDAPMDGETEEQYVKRISREEYDGYKITVESARAIGRQLFLLKAINEIKCVSNLQPILRRIVTGE